MINNNDKLLDNTDHFYELDKKFYVFIRSYLGESANAPYHEYKTSLLTSCYNDCDVCEDIVSISAALLSM